MPRFTDPQLLAILRKAVRRVNRRLALTGTADEISIDSSGDISPDNADLEDLVLLQAECLISYRDYQDSINSGAGDSITDGEQTVDTTTSLVARGTFFDSPHAPCAELEKAINLEKLNRMGDFGKLVW